MNLWDNVKPNQFCASVIDRINTHTHTRRAVKYRKYSLEIRFWRPLWPGTPAAAALPENVRSWPHQEN